MKYLGYGGKQSDVFARVAEVRITDIDHGPENSGIKVTRVIFDSVTDGMYSLDKGYNGVFSNEVIHDNKSDAMKLAIKQAFEKRPKRW